MQNIGADNAGDAFYRYKMPKLIAKIEGRGNGIKTNIVNNVDIAKALERPPEYVLKYFGCELGAQTNFDKGSGTSIVNGAHDQKKLCELLEGFIKKYVQCYSCGNPETVVKIKKDFIFLKCKACGYVSEVDMRHKLNTFILKNPPENKMTKEEKKLKKAEEERLRDAKAADKKDKKKKKEDKEKKKKKSDDKAEGEDGGSPAEEAEAEVEDGEDDEESEEVVWMTDTSEEAARKRAAEQLTSATAAMVTVGNIDAEKEEARKKAEKEAKKKAEEEAARKAEEEARAAAAAQLAAQLSLLDGGDKLDAGTAVEALRAVLPTLEPAQLGSIIKKMNVEGGLVGKMRALFEAMIAGSKAVLPTAFKTNQKLLAAAAKDAPSQLAMLVALEWLVTVCEPDRVKEVAAGLKALFDLDLCEDEVITAWYEAPAQGALKLLGAPLEGVKSVRKACEPVYEWLLEESDEEDEEEDDE